MLGEAEGTGLRRLQGRSKRDDRLIVEHELLMLERGAQAAREGELTARVDVLARVQAAQTGGCSLAVAHGHIGVLEQLFGALGVIWEDADPDARPQPEVLVGDRERLAQHLVHLAHRRGDRR